MIFIIFFEQSKLASLIPLWRKQNKPFLENILVPRQYGIYIYILPCYKGENKL